MAENETADTSTTETDTAAADAATTETDKTEIPAEVKAALRKANKEAETLRLRLKEFEDRDKTDAEKLQERAAAAEARAEALESQNLRREVADEKGLTPAQAKRLVGTTREELEADADDVLATFPTGKATTTFTDVGQGVRNENAAGRIYRKSELENHAFYVANKDDIQKALKEGRITD
ncbi:hypothetical protein [Leifsonia sp. NPDC058248]|uniref:hypothetical protein n=1 Tax=Leifsonia sp. NPDC058248 TaxID=3346402 RepID=UPI0036DC237B